MNTLGPLSGSVSGLAGPGGKSGPVGPPPSAGTAPIQRPHGAALPGGHCPTIVVVEDEVTICRAIADRLRAEGWQVEMAHDGPSGVALVGEVSPDLVVLDVMLPGFDGLEVCRRIQADRPVPVLMLTARDDETDMLVGLGVGADDYMTKPFSMRELVARLKALLRRVQRAQPAPSHREQTTLAVGDLVIDRAAHRVTRAGVPAHLTPTEYDLLVCLAEVPGTVLSREQLLEDVWDWVDATGTRTVDSHVKALRRKLGSDIVRTVHGVGYALEVPEDPEDATSTSETR
ncbi:response regulator transcription factor [Devriesea agamarum]|uniref:response regulator transcription factor n=1 Tax=Devriesea agamarum TaxID=472569 RepID=UPI0009FF3DB2|nr:response regulator transcription factor [Devriesea agamarum]